MSINKFYKLRLVIILIIVDLISIGSCCTDIEWSCDSGQCIASDELCDGNTDCSDGSDETADVCIQQSCPSFAFRCAYGACVAKSAECNGIKECADNSDETSSLCPDNLNTRNTLCQDDQFQCTSGDCIDLDNACDGHSDCRDQSDETVGACASFNCPTFAFRCGYGACISKFKICNGIPDCRDGSDETRKLCGEKTYPTSPTKTPPTLPGPTRPTKRPPVSPPPTRPPIQGCKAPNIPNSILKYEMEPTKIMRPGEEIPDGTSMVYECVAGYYREGPQYNLCFDSKWYSVLDASCVKYCPYHKLKGVTFRASCEKDGISVKCDERIRPGTSARLFCQHKYRKPARNPPDTLVCQEDGQWDYEPFRCEPVCGKELLISTAFSVNGIDTNITYVPWHAGIYQNFAGNRFKHVCGATIVSAKVLVTAAHCFWDFANQKAFDKSYFTVGAGKYLRDYYANERNAEFKNISEIAIPPDFRGDIENYKGDIAVIVLTNFLTFSPFIAPACIDWQQAGAKAIKSNIYGQIPGWGIDNSGDFSKVLRTIDVPSTSYADCLDKVGTQLASAVTNDKFCVINTSGSVVCQGDSGGGFIVKTLVNGEYINYLWGVVSGGLPQGNCCEEPFINCNNIDGSDCLPYEKVCDGKIDCFDKSDETADTCVQQINCPPLSFRCAYGACVPSSARCNGTTECADNSDEIPILCNSNFIKLNSICLKDEFMCNSGECIAQENVCDGRIDCLDRSDETVEICASNLCDDMFFRCGYGACLSTDTKCDGQIDCADGSDEASMLCYGIKRKTPLLPASTPLPLPSTLPLETTTRFDKFTCTVPDIKNSRITLESDTNNPLKAGDKIPNFNFIKYGCEHGFFREGKVELNFCSNGTWFSNIHPPCIRYCPHEELHGVTFNVKCILNGVTVSCEERISPGTVAIVTCPTKYRIPDHNPIQTLLCSEKGQWDYTPSRCIPICGDELIPSVPFLTNADKTNITAVPWHVGVYINQKSKYKHHCGGTIISAKVVISAAHCFWDNANQKPYPNSLYSIGAGKYFREYYEGEIKAQIRNISQIAIPEEYAGEDSKYKADLAVIIVTSPFIFSEFVSPICVEWKQAGAKAIKSGSYGKVAGWGKTEEGIYSTELKTVSVTASSNEACKNEVESQYADAITDDKFCILNKFEKNACQGDSGGGFAVQKEIFNRNRYFLWGIVSTGVPLGLTCSNYQFVSYTNIQYYEDFITDLEIRNRAK